MQIAETGLKMNVWEESKESINVVRGEAKARKLKITVVEPVRVTDSIGNESVELKPIDLTGKTIELWAKKSDGTEACSQGEVTDAAKGECTVGITSQMCAEPSSVIPLVELRIIDAETGAMLKAKGPTINVLNGIDDSGVVSSDDYSVLVQTIAEANAAIGKAESALTTAEKANSTANKAVADLGDLIPRGEAA
ncbi:hypothetical protein F1904_11675, partial [Akkermansia muciniphila]|uniref:hypothetical protein n=1 Tax=Akkermansia muciniphila TaxID=239935 RepID=UPI00122F0488